MSKHSYDEAWEKRLRSISYAVLVLEQANASEDGGQPRLTDVRMMLDRDNRTSVLVVLKAERGDEKLVAFIGGVSLSDTLLAVAKKLQARAVDWRADRPWGERGA